MFDIKRIEFVRAVRGNPNLIRYSVALNNITTDIFYDIIKVGGCEIECTSEREDLNVILEFVINKEDLKINLVSIKVSNDFCEADISLTLENLTEYNRELIINRLMNLFDFKEHSNNKLLLDVISNVIADVLDEKRGQRLATSKNHCYNILSDAIYSKISLLFPFYYVDCSPVFNRPRTVCGKNWRIKIQKNINDDYTLDVFLPITITLSRIANNRNGLVHYSLKDISLLDSEYLTKSIGELEDEIVQYIQKEKDEENRRRKENETSFILEKEKDVELLRYKLSSFNSEEILKSSLNEIVSSSSCDVSLEQIELFNKCKAVMQCMESYFYQIEDLSKINAKKLKTYNI